VLAWRTKHQVREDDPILAVLDPSISTVSRNPHRRAAAPPRRARAAGGEREIDAHKDFATQSLDLIIELRRAKFS
jgi:hypothetical protein